MKLRLAVEELQVDSFATVADGFAPRAGTVFGQNVVPEPVDVTIKKTQFESCTCGEYTYAYPYYSCVHNTACSFESCPGTCPMGGTCRDSCYACPEPVDTVAHD